MVTALPTPIVAEPGDLPDPVRLAAEAPEPPARSVVTAAGIPFAHASWGDPAAPPLLLVHGLTASAAIWWRVGPALAAAGWRVVAPDLPGHGATGAWAGHTMDVWFLNENHVAWLDGVPYVFSPDLIILADPVSGEGYTNTEIKAGDPVAVLGAKVFPAFRSPKGIEFFGPRYWGFDFDYVPIEEVVKG